MLRLILGRAKSGKTACIMEEIRRLVAEKKENTVLLVPEQYSHEAEMELLRVCGDSLSLYAEVLSFSRLASRVETELGARPGKALDKGGRLLCLVRALDAVGSRLKVYGAARRQSHLQESLLSAIDELKASCLGCNELEMYGARCRGLLGDKLRDMALIYGAYEAIVANGHLDPMDKLSYLADDIGRSKLRNGSFYMDGFTDFTLQERSVLESLLRSGAELTVCLNCEGLDECHEIFEASRKAAGSLSRMAEKLGVKWEIRSAEAEKDGSAMAFIEKELFAFGSSSMESDAVRLVTADSIGAECEGAAARCLELVKEKGCRWKDIAVAVRGFEDYRAALASSFARYGVPTYAAAKSSIGDKPLCALISEAFEIISGGWDESACTAYLKTGLTGLGQEESDTLENYIFTWSLRGSAWTKDSDWNMHPEGYNATYDEETAEKLQNINLLRRRFSAPLLHLQREGRQALTACRHTQVLWEYFQLMRLPETLEKRSELLRSEGFEQQAAEYVQLWDIVVSAMEQCSGILADTEMDQESFGRLFCLVLSKYEVGTIPLSLDRVLLGDMDRMRRRNIKHLIVLGGDSSRIPLISGEGSIFTDDDRLEMSAEGMDIGNSADERLCHEFALIYNCFSLPSETLYLSRAAAGENGSAQPCFVFSRLEKLFGKSAETVDLDKCRRLAPIPAFELALKDEAAAEYFRSIGKGEALERLKKAAAMERGRLSGSSVHSLYGEKPRLSASRIDKLASCPFAYFMQYGLKLKARKAAAFSPPEMGTFMHYILENVAHDAIELGGFAKLEGQALDGLCEKYVEKFIAEELNGFQNKSRRFVHLFKRLCKSVRRIVEDMAAELSLSEFKPLDFELDFGRREDFPPVELGEDEGKLILTGIADRVDGWIHEGKLYVRVVDYKTGFKSFSLSDVWYGMGLQMLLYLFALEKNGGKRYNMEIVPAGVLYIPARDVLVSARADISDEEIVAAKAKALKRSGLLLDDASVLQAMEQGESPRFIPVSFKKGAYSGSALASAENLGELSRHIDETLCALARELHEGSIKASPFFRSEQDCACLYCDFKDSCRFDEDQDERRYMGKMKPEEVWALLGKESAENG